MKVAAVYDAVAWAYAEKFRDELDAKPFDRKLLDDLASEVRVGGRLLDLG